MMASQVDSQKQSNQKQPAPCECRNTAHISQSSKTDGTPYLRGWCRKCKSWVYSDKKYCICCRREVKHTVHYLRLKRIYNKGVNDNQDLIKKHEKTKYESGLIVEVEFKGSYYHIPLNMLVRYAFNDYKKETMYQFQDAIMKVKRPKTLAH
jgi:hypothetical protein